MPEDFQYHLARYTLPFVNSDLNELVKGDKFKLTWRREFCLIFPPDGMDVIDGASDSAILAVDLGKAFLGVSDSPGFSFGEMIRIGVTTLSNIPRLVTEFLPAYLQLLLWKAICELIKIRRHLALEPTGTWFGRKPKVINYAKRGLCLGLIGVAALFFVVVKCWNLVGTATTSPASSMRQAWEAGNKLGEAITENLFWQSVLKKVFAGFLATLSLAMTVAVYVVVFPLGIKAAITHGFSFISTAVKALAHIPGVQAIGHAVLRAVSPVVSTFSASSVAATLIAAATVIGVPTKALWNMAKEGWKFCKKKIEEWWSPSNSEANVQPRPTIKRSPSLSSGLSSSITDEARPSLDANALGVGLRQEAENLASDAQKVVVNTRSEYTVAAITQWVEEQQTKERQETLSHG